MFNNLAKSAWELAKFVIITLLIVVPIRTFIAQPFIVSGQSMYPTFDDNEYLIVDELSYHLRKPERGEVIVFRFPQDPDKHFIKRIIGLPGETVSIRDNEVLITTSVDTIKIEEPYADSHRLADMTRTLGENEYFVMGDNRAVSLDSRSWGPLPEELITGRALVRLFPPSRVGILPGAVEYSLP